MAVPEKYIDKDIYKRAKAKADKTYKVPSAYKSAFLVAEYKRLGGRVDESKSKGGLKRWFGKEQWKNLTPFAEGLTKSKTEYKCGEKAPKQKGPSVCRPKAETKKYNKKQIKEAVDLKLKGKQIVWSKLKK
tara:strand:- start:338 stop:730 length:393 start_codon:yes stop_codon:yes gene_type:complete